MLSFGKKNRGEIRLNGRAHLALRVVDQALRKYLSSESIGWSHMNITQYGADRSNPHEYQAFFEGVFFATDPGCTSKGSVLVRMALVGDEWVSTSVQITDRGTIDGTRESMHVAYITRFESARVLTHNFDDVILEMRTPHRID